MLSSIIARRTAIVAVFGLAALAPSGRPQNAAPRQFAVVLKRGPKWIEGKPAAEQNLNAHGRFLQTQMEKGALQLAGPFLDNSGGLIIYNAKDEADARNIEERDPGVADGILAIDWIRPFSLSFNAATGQSPFKR